MNTSSKKHHFITQAQLRHFSSNEERKKIFIFDKKTKVCREDLILQTGMQKKLNTAILENGQKINFENIFSDIDSKSAPLLGKIIGSQSIDWLSGEDRLLISDLMVTQILRTNMVRTTLTNLTDQLAEILKEFGHDIDTNISSKPRNNPSIQLSAVSLFVRREKLIRSLLRLTPVLFIAKDQNKFVLSDNPVIIANLLPYGENALSSHGIHIMLPIAPTLAIALVCPTIIKKHSKSIQIEVGKTEVANYNLQQISQSNRFLYSATNNFDFEKEYLKNYPEFEEIKSFLYLGKTGEGPPRKTLMPSGYQLVINGQYDSCMLAISEMDEKGEGITAKTKDIKLLKAVSEDRGMLSIELYEDGYLRQGMQQAMIELLDNEEEGWFRAVHREPPMRSLAKLIDSKRA